MSQKNKNQLAVWKDSHHATVAGRENADTTDFTVIGHSKNAGAEFMPVKKMHTMINKYCNTNFLKPHQFQPVLIF